MCRVLAILLTFSSTLVPSLLGQEATAARVGWRPLFNGVDLEGWHGQRHFSPYKLAAMSITELAKFRAADDASVKEHWSVENGELVNDGHGAFLTTDADYGDAEFKLEYKTVAKADSGIYLRGTPQVQIWDYTEAGGKWKIGADKGSGGLWNNQKHERFPPMVADLPFGRWNKLHIKQVGDVTWVTMNGILTADGVVMENFWDRAKSLPATGPLQLQTHGGEIRFRNLQVREIDGNQARSMLRTQGGGGFTRVFDGTSFDGWQGAIADYEIVEGALRCKPGKGGNLYTVERYSDFTVQFEFKLPPGGNNGLAIRYPGKGDSAYTGLELQVLDNTAQKFAKLKPWQYHGSVYGVVASKRGHLRPVGEWNFQEVTMLGSHVKVTLNGIVIVDADISGLKSNLKGHVGKDRTEGHFGFCGHNDPVEFRDVRIKRLDGGGK